MARISDLEHDEILLPEFLTSAVADALIAYAEELNLAQDDHGFVVLAEFANDVTQVVLRALRRRTTR